MSKTEKNVKKQSLNRQKFIKTEKNVKKLSKNSQKCGKTEINVVKTLNKLPKLSERR